MPVKVPSKSVPEIDQNKQILIAIYIISIINNIPLLQIHLLLISKFYFEYFYRNKIASLQFIVYFLGSVVTSKAIKNPLLDIVLTCFLCNMISGNLKQKLTSPWYLNESYTDLSIIQKGQRNSNLNSNM